ncbi:MAG: pkn2A [Elusimicrobia bacterium]|nr:MAG: pkn2A [Elusimicrobiota bacterium]
MTTTRNLTILLTDIKGFTDKTSHKSRVDIDAMLAEHREIVLPALEDRGGRLLKTIGDAFLMTFDSPTNAVLAGVGVQEALRRRNEGRVGEDRLEVRIAINVGEGVFLAMNKAEVPSSEVGYYKLSGIDREVRVYKVRWETPLSGTTEPPAAAVRAAKAVPLGERAPKARPVDAPGAPLGAPRPAPKEILRPRVLAGLIDGAVCFAAGLGLPGGGSFWWLVMNAGAVGGWSSTLGQRIMGLKVVTHEDDLAPDPKTSLLRAAMSLVSLWTFGLGYVWAFWEKDGRGWHDLVAGTRVARAKSA